MAKKLKNLVIENIGLVNNGANQLADMVLSKRAPEPSVAKVGETITVAQGTVVKFILKERTNG